MKNIKVGVFGAGRGCAIALNFAKINAKIIAIKLPLRVKNLTL